MKKYLIQSGIILVAVFLMVMLVGFGLGESFLACLSMSLIYAGVCLIIMLATAGVIWVSEQ